MYIHTKRNLLSRPVAAVLVGSLVMPTLSGCGGGNNTASIPPPVDATRGQAPGQPGASSRPGLSTKQKVVLLAGAAAIYYLYKKRQNAQGQTVQYYRSKNGRIYYRDPKTHQAIWVTPEDVRPIQVPADEAAAYRNYRGYDNSQNGIDPTNQIPLAPGGAY